MKRTLFILLLFAVANILYSVFSNREDQAEQVAERVPVRVAPHIRSAAATAPATATPVPAKALAAETGGPAANGSRNRPPMVFEKGNLHLQNMRDPAEARAAQDQFVNAYRSGAKLQMGTDRFDILNLRAIPKDEYDESMGPVVSKKLDYVFVAGAEGLQTGNTLPVVARESNGIIGIVTGTVKVQLKDLSAVSPVAQTHGLTVKFVDETTKLVFFGTSPATPLADLLSALRSDPSVEDATLEVIQSHKRF